MHGKQKKILLIGNGFLSKKISTFLNTKKIINNYCKKKGYFSLGDLKYKLKNNYNFAIILFGKTSIKFCEKFKKEAFKVNVKKTIDVIEILKKKNIKIIYVSSDSVFSGKKNLYYPSSKQDNKLQYGFQKAIIENKYKKDKNFCILRISKIIDSSPNFFVMYKKKKYQKKICAPIFSNDVCLIIYKIINDFRSGIFQYSSSPLVSNDIFIKNKYKKKKLLFPKMYNNIFKYYKKTKENTSSKSIIKKIKKNGL